MYTVIAIDERNYIWGYGEGRTAVEARADCCKNSRSVRLLTDHKYRRRAKHPLPVITWQVTSPKK